MEMSTKACGVRTNVTAKGRIIIQTEKYIEACIIMGKDTAMGFSIIRMETGTKAPGRMEALTVSACITIPLEKSILATTKTTNDVAEVGIFTKMVLCMKATGTKEIRKE